MAPSISGYSQSSEHKWTWNAMIGAQCQRKPWFTEENRENFGHWIDAEKYKTIYVFNYLN